MDEERLKRLTYPEIKEIAEQGVEPDLTMHRKRQIIKENFSWFFITSDVYVPHIFQIVGEKLLNKITDSFNTRKRSDPEFDTKYDTLDDYITDDKNLYVDEEAELMFAALGDAMASWGENSYEQEEENPYRRRRPRRRTQRRWNAPRRRPQRRSRSSLYRGGKKSLKKRR